MVQGLNRAGNTTPPFFTFADSCIVFVSVLHTRPQVDIMDLTGCMFYFADIHAQVSGLQVASAVIWELIPASLSGYDEVFMCKQHWGYYRL